jgi:hypothetical protein
MDWFDRLRTMVNQLNDFKEFIETAPCSYSPKAISLSLVSELRTVCLETAPANNKMFACLSVCFASESRNEYSRS